MTVKSNQIKLYAICYDIILKSNLPLMKMLFIEYCKIKLSEKQLILLLIISKLMYNSNMNKDPLYEFMNTYINDNKQTILLQLLNI
tara:strand:+ start:208 stop:465 length:258 start_codon:yes stop_codon:yes gene_type:complete